MDTEILKHLQWRLEEHYDPGASVVLILGLFASPTAQQVQKFKESLIQKGLAASVEYGTSKEWPEALQLLFRRPPKKSSVMPESLSAVLEGALTISQLPSIIGFSVGSGNASIFARRGK